MARGRFISESVAKDMRLNSLSIEAELVYLMTIPHLDRDGLIEGDTDLLFGTVCPKRRQFQDSMGYFIEEWVACGLVTLYYSSEGPVLWFRGFAKNQTGLRYERETPSIFPPPPGYKHTKTGMVAVTTPEAASEQVDDAPPPSDSTPQQSKDESAQMTEPSDKVPEASDNWLAQVQEQEQVQVKDQVQELNEDDDAQARDPLHAAWFETYEDEMPEHLKQPIAELVIEVGQEATIHGIRASTQAKERSFKYIAKCARNYIPPPPQNANYTNGYHVEVDSIPGIHALTPVADAPPQTLPRPMPTDDPWATVLFELLPTLTPTTAGWFKDSELTENGELAGVPFYLITVRTGPDKLVWLKRQTESNIRRKLGSLIGKRVEIDFVATELEPTP